MQVSSPAGSILAQGAGSEGQQVIAAKLAKNQQKAEGQAALQLIQGADALPPPSANPAVGQNINIKV